MTKQQKIYMGILVSILLYIIVKLILPENSSMALILSRIDILGLFLLEIAVLALLRINGAPVLNVAETAKDCVNWDLFVMVAVIMFYSSSLLDDSTGIREWLIEILVPFFSGHSPIVFMLAVLIVGLIVTNVANNAVTGAILVQVIVAVAPSLGIANTVPLAMILTLTVFLAALTPAASPYVALMFTNKEWLSKNDIIKYGFKSYDFTGLHLTP